MRKYGWIKQKEDPRDFRKEHAPRFLASQPSKIDRLTMPLPIFDQGHIGSCTGHAGKALVEYQVFKESGTLQEFSALYLYNLARILEGTFSEDSGAQLRDIMKVIGTCGAALEKAFPYTQRDLFRKPCKAAIRAAKRFLGLEYRAIEPKIENVKAALAEGLPVIEGFEVYKSFESPLVANTGLMPMPQKGETVLSGHATLIDGYDDNSRNGDFWIRNSWGKTWGIGGWFKCPYDAIPLYFSDLWVLQKIEVPA